MSRKLNRSQGAVLLRAWRGEMSQVETSKLLKTDAATYCKFESGARRPGGSWAARIEAFTRGKVPSSSWYQPAAVEALDP